MSILLFDAFDNPIKFKTVIPQRELWKIFLCKLPTFDPSWSQEIISKWQECYFSLWKWGTEIDSI